MFENQQPNSPTPGTPPPNIPTPPATPPPATPPAMPPSPSTGSTSPASTPPPAGDPSPKIYTMPEKFRANNNGKSPSGGGTKRLVIILVVVLVVAGLGIAGLYVFQNVLNKPANDNLNVNLNRNTNLNTNTANLNTANTNTANLNANTNANLNENANTNANTNGNGNDNANSNANQNTNTTVSTTPLPSSADADDDGLTDTEELAYGTDAKKPDTDGDGFIDGKKVQTDGSIIGEIYLGFNPTGTGKLEDSTIVKRQANSSNTYSLLIPSTWTAVLDQGGGVLVTPSQSTGETFQVRVSANPTNLTPQAWYQQTINASANTSSLKTEALNGFEILYSENMATAYLFQGTSVYSIAYDTGSLTQANYWTTFDMMVRSFKLVASS